LARAFRESIETFLGPQEDLIDLSNQDLSGDEMLPALKEAVGEIRDGAVVFTSLFGGSCWQTAERLRKENSQVRHLTGLNLPMLLTFVNKRTSLSLDALFETLSEHGKKGIQP
jgi:mannose/fructose-specific phosphotransferase system component IIA